VKKVFYSDKATQILFRSGVLIVKVTIQIASVLKSGVS
jgi:hypothetical protein